MLAAAQPALAWGPCDREDNAYKDAQNEVSRRSARLSELQRLLKAEKLKLDGPLAARKSEVDGTLSALREHLKTQETAKNLFQQMVSVLTAATNDTDRLQQFDEALAAQISATPDIPLSRVFMLTLNKLKSSLNPDQMNELTSLIALLKVLEQSSDQWAQNARNFTSGLKLQRGTLLQLMEALIQFKSKFEIDGIRLSSEAASYQDKLTLVTSEIDTSEHLVAQMQAEADTHSKRLPLVRNSLDSLFQSLNKCWQIRSEVTERWRIR